MNPPFAQTGEGGLMVIYDTGAYAHSEADN